jgi:Grx4 family monothiol glutaredoxin
MPATHLTSESQLQSLGNDLLVLNFWADWCKPCAQLNPVVDQLADSYPNVRFLHVEAEKAEEITSKFGVESVPYFLFIKNQTVFDKIEGANAPELANKVEKYSQVKGSSKEARIEAKDSKQELFARLEKLTSFAPVMLFMKGTPSAPQCGFSRKMVDILKNEKIKFHSFNILSDEEVRQGLKEMNNWPTYPQLYVKGKLIGGLDIVKEMADDGELKSVVPPECLQQDLNTRLSTLINSAPVMLFMKGTPTQVQCGFSRQMVDLLNKNNVTFSSFNILEDDEVRQGLKTFSNWPTYPQLYSKGKLIGGLDIVKELAEDGDLLSTLGN